MADIILQDIVKIYGVQTKKRKFIRKKEELVPQKRAVDGVTLTIPHGSFTVLVGPSGCGKTTMLRMIAGLEEITSGKIMMGDIDITNLDPGDRGLAMVFQNYALYPHMTVRENIEFGLVNARIPKFEIKERVDNALEIVGLSELGQRRPGKMSGGQRQRVALARAISKLPEGSTWSITGIGKAHMPCMLAGLAAGVWSGTGELRRLWRCDTAFSPAMPPEQREHLLEQWHRAVGRSRDWAR